MNSILNEVDYESLKNLIEQTPHEHRDHYRDLRRKLEGARCMEAEEIPSDVVPMGATVWLRELESGDLWTFTLCYPEEANVDRNCISVLSPLGTAIIGQRVGDIVDWPVPGGTVQIQIEELVGQPEAAGIGNSPDLVNR